MARSLYARAAARGFPVFDVSGQSGQGALQDSTLPSGIQAGQPDAAWSDPNQDPGSQPAQVPLPEIYVLGGSLWGLPGSPNPDNNPESAPDRWSPQGGTHAAPAADPTLPIGEYYAEADATHAAMFSSPAVRRDVGTKLASRLEHSGPIEGNGPVSLQPLTGQIRSNAGRDAVQGYGGGGPGPGGTNLPELTVDDRAYPGEVYRGSPGTFVSAAEVPHYDAVADQFIASAPEFPPYMPSYDVPTASTHAQDVPAVDTPAQGPPVQAAAYTYVPGFWG